MGVPTARAPTPDEREHVGVSSGGLRNKLVKRLNLRFKVCVCVFPFLYAINTGKLLNMCVTLNPQLDM